MEEVLAILNLFSKDLEYLKKYLRGIPWSEMEKSE